MGENKMHAVTDMKMKVIDLYLTETYFWGEVFL
jgi:hypothetical protein